MSKTRYIYLRDYLSSLEIERRGRTNQSFKRKRREDLQSFIRRVNKEADANVSLSLSRFKAVTVASVSQSRLNNPRLRSIGISTSFRPKNRRRYRLERSLMPDKIEKIETEYELRNGENVTVEKRPDFHPNVSLKVYVNFRADFPRDNKEYGSFSAKYSCEPEHVEKAACRLAQFAVMASYVVHGEKPPEGTLND